MRRLRNGCSVSSWPSLVAEEGGDFEGWSASLGKLWGRGVAEGMKAYSIGITSFLSRNGLELAQTAVFR